MNEHDELITVDLDENSAARELPLTELRKIIGDHLNATNYAAAASICMQLAEKMPDTFWPHHVAAECLYLCEQVETALRYVNRALAIAPVNTGGYVVKARICMQVGDHEQAFQLIDSAIGINPQDSKLHMIKAELLADSGDIDGARESYLKSVDLDVRNATSLLGLSRLPGDNFSAELIKMVKFVLHSHQLSGENEIKAHFALVHAYDKIGDVARHFAHLRAGNELNSRFVDFDPVASGREAQQTIEFFSREFLARHEHEQGHPARIVFIVGFPRCGSTLVDQILCSHPDVRGAGETHALDQAIADFTRARNLTTGYPGWIDELPTGALMEIADRYLERVEMFNNGVCMTDKLLNNYMLTGLIHLIFPNAKVINVQRNPIDVCYSCYKNLFFFRSVPFAYNLDHLASKYREYRRVIDHWNEVLPGKIHTIEYERLIERQQESTRELLEHCELPWNEACLNFHESKQAVRTSSNIQVRQKLYRDSIDRWKKYEHDLQPLLELTNS